jgi:hypothetical protein
MIVQTFERGGYLARCVEPLSKIVYSGNQTRFCEDLWTVQESFKLKFPDLTE